MGKVQYLFASNASERPPPPPPESTLSLRELSFRQTFPMASVNGFHSSIRFKALLKEILAVHDLSRDELFAATRVHTIVEARHEFWFRARQETRLSFPQIARLSHPRFHHTTIMSAFGAVTLRLYMGYRMRTRPDVCGPHPGGSNCGYVLDPVNSVAVTAAE